MDSNQAGIFDIALTMVPGVGPRMIRMLLPAFGSAENVFRQPRAKLMRFPGIGPFTVKGFGSSSILRRAEEELKLAEERGIRILCMGNEHYPRQLMECPDAPSLIYYSGQNVLNHSRVIAVVGTRKATDYGKEMVETMIRDWAGMNVMIVSGLAYGIDITAHRAAISNNIPTVAVLGSGLGWIYPAAHRKTAEEIKRNGGIISEFPWMTRPDAENFPRRNRIVAGLSQVTVVIEAAESGGALITAEIANSYDREIMAVPGRIGDPFSLGCLKLIRENKAHVLTSSSDLPRLMGWLDEALPRQTRLFPDLDPEEQKIIELLHAEGELSLDAISIRSGFKLNQVSALMLGLELKSVVKAMPGKRYRNTVA